MGVSVDVCVGECVDVWKSKGGWKSASVRIRGLM